MLPIYTEETNKKSRMVGPLRVEWLDYEKRRMIGPLRVEWLDYEKSRMVGPLKE